MSHEPVNEALHGRSGLRAIRPRLRFKRRQLAVPLGSGSSGSKSSVRLRPCSSGYLRLYNRHVVEFNADEDILDALPGKSRRSPALQDSHIFGTLWTATEKERFFKSLSRRGKSQVEVIASDIKTKSVVEVLGYLHLLRSSHAAIRQQQSRVIVSKRHHLGLLTYAELPVAAEISDYALAVERRESDKLQAYINQRRHMQESQTLGWSVIDSRTTRQIRQLLTTTSRDEDGPQSLVSQVTPDLELFDTREVLQLLRALSSAHPAHGGFKTTGLYRSTLRAMHDRVVALSRTLVGAAIRLAEARHEAEASAYFQREGKFSARGQVSRMDVITAVRTVRSGTLGPEWDAPPPNPVESSSEASSDDNDVDDPMETETDDELARRQEDILERMDARNDRVVESEVRRVLGLSLRLSLPAAAAAAACTRREVASVAGYAMGEEEEDTYADI